MSRRATHAVPPEADRKPVSVPAASDAVSEAALPGVAAEPGKRAPAGTLKQRVADAQVTHISLVLDEQADRLMEDAAHITQQAAATRDAAVRLDAHADDLHRRADRLHARADLLRDERDAIKT